MKFTRDNNLSFSNVSRQVRNWVGNIVTRHGQNWELCNRSLLALDNSSTLVEHSKVSVHVTRVTTSPRNFFTCSTDLSKCITVVGHVRVDNENGIVVLECEVFSSCQCKTRRNDSLDSRVVSKVDEQCSVFKRTGSLQVGTEEIVFFSGNTHCTENDNKLLIASLQLCLSSDLQCNVVVRKTRSRENWQLLSTNECCTAVDCRNSSLNEIMWALSAVWVDCSTDDVSVFFSNDVRSTVTRSPCTIENSTDKVLANWEFENIAHEGYTSGSVNLCSSFENLDDNKIV